MKDLKLELDDTNFQNQIKMISDWFSNDEISIKQFEELVDYIKK